MKRNVSWQTARFAAVVIAGGVTVACSGVESGQITAVHHPDPGVERLHREVVAAHAPPAQRARVEAAVARASWVGELHRAVMTQVRSRLVLLGRTATRQAKCQALSDVALNELELSRTKGDVSLSVLELKAIITRTAEASKACHGVTSLSVLGITPNIGTFRETTTSSDSDITDAGMILGGEVVDAQEATDGMPSDVASAGAATLDGATGSSDAALDFAAAIADFGASSSESWYESASSGSMDRDSTRYLEEPYSVLRLPWWAELLAPWMAVDENACIGAAQSAYSSGEHNWKHLVGYCLGAGAVASGLVFIIDPT